MFLSPAVNFSTAASSENVGSVARKPGMNSIKKPSPFKDRSVNTGTPRPKAPFKEASAFTSKKLDFPLSSPKVEPVVYSENDMRDFFIFPEKNNDPDESYECKFYGGNAMTKKDVFNILGTYCGYRSAPTPPPEFEIYEDDEFDIKCTGLELSFSWQHDSGYEDDVVIQDVPEPEYEHIDN